MMTYKTLQQKLPFTLIVFLLGLVLVGTTSCNRKGCTDPKANNYDSRSKKDDKSCQYDSEGFIKSYAMTEECDGSFSYTLVISLHDDLSYVMLENLGGWVNQVDIAALVDGDQLSFDDVVNGNRFVGTGGIETLTNSDGVEYTKLTLSYQVLNDQNEVIASCTSVSN